MIVVVALGPRSMPEQYSAYKSKPASLLSHLFGHEGKGSILSLLKSKGWGLELMAGTLTNERGFSCFGVEIDVPPAALEHTEEIVSIVYQYVRMLIEAGPQAWMFEEVQAISNAAFRFANKRPPMSYATQVAQNMQQCEFCVLVCLLLCVCGGGGGGHHARLLLTDPPEHVLTGPRLYWDCTFVGEAV